MKTTIALLCWNQSNFVAQALKSIAGQTTNDFSLFVVDNGSTDGSQDEILSTLKELDLKANLIFNESNLGIAAALNSVIELSEDEFFIPFASDDLMLPDRVRHQQQLFLTLPEKVGVLGSACQYLFEDGSLGSLISAPRSRSQGELRRALILGRQPPAPGVMIRTDVLKRLKGYDVHCPIEDYDIWVRIVFELGLSVYSDTKVVSLYRRHSENYSSKSLIMSSGVAYSLARFGGYSLSSGERRALRSAFRALVSPRSNWVRMLDALSQGDKSGARHFAVRALVERGNTAKSLAKIGATLLFPTQASRRVKRTTGNQNLI